MSTWKRRIRWMAVAAAVVMFGAGTAHGTEPVRIGWVYAMANAPVLIAQADGHFEAQGLDVTLDVVSETVDEIGTVGAVDVNVDVRT